MKTYESIEDILTEKIYAGTVASIEKFLGYTMTLNEVCDIDGVKRKIRDKLDNMTEDELLSCELMYMA